MKLWDFDFKFGTWNLKFWDLGFWKLRIEILIMKSRIWISFLKIEGLDLKIGHWKCGIENLGMKIWGLKNLNFYPFFWGGGGD